MNPTSYPATQFFKEMLERLAAANPNDAQPPHIKKPTGVRLDFIGYADDYHKALCMVMNKATEEHAAAHAATGMPFGANSDLPIEHRKLHAIQLFATSLLMEDVINRYGNLMARRSMYIDTDWKIYAYDSPLGGLISLL